MASNQNLPGVPVRYRLDFFALVRQLVPVMLRKPRLLAWLYALLAPLRGQYTIFIDFEAQTRRELSYNGQKMVFERALNLRFDPFLRRIRIVNADTELLPEYDYNRVEEHLPEQFMYLANEHPPASWEFDYFYQEFVTQLDFMVRVPLGINTPEKTLQLHAFIRRYKLATKRYSLLFV
ncbi:hypothetical protein GCM10023185_15660 [Hymenobacter saemangeumensis]|uniref:Uncharacterized protein n=1 Tax=Hymenobacter saemangeumensis TaxID=1084522 RepID=A0ABP8I9F5_9BACT